ncbi:unnamed protein product [Rotaria sp. Silwood1]|nr:unnamed protein product [Rotaria sp. Silwood1]CAF3390456.1 unnamed protein product [Rotaria sp. Silwood1]CAF4516500.1 unnamed protein product [Rotaria sp. Silwood1]CAF4516812.1 unnamed protein product [Rotaria sp. Silwood1]
MLATAHHSNRYTKSRIYENEWIDNSNKRISWLNYFTIQTIPEETDNIDCPIRNYSDSDSSSLSSMEDCYVVFEVQRPRSTTETRSIIEKQLNFAQIIDDKHHTEYNQIAQSIINEIPSKEHAIEHRTESTISTQLSNNILIHKPNIFNQSSSISHNIAKLKTNYKTTEHRSLSFSSKPIDEKQSRYNSNSIESLDSIENDSPERPRIITTFAHLSLHRKSNPIQIQQEKSFRGKTTLTRTFAFDHICMEKCDRVNNEKIINVEANNNDEMNLPFYLNNKSNTNKNSSISNDVMETSPLLRSLKKRSRAIKSEYYLPEDDIKPNDTSIFQMKYFDGRHTVADHNTRASIEESQFFSSSISSRTSLSKIFQPDDITANSSLRKRILHRFQNFLKPNSTEKSRPWQHKTIFELFTDRKSKTDRH